MKKPRNISLILIGLLMSVGSVMLGFTTNAQETESAKINIEQQSMGSGLTINDFTQSSNSPFATPIGPSHPEVADFNNDGIQDILVPNFSGRVSYFAGTGNGNFAPAVNITTGGNNTTSGLAVNDFNRDGKQDFAAANSNANNVVIFLGNGAGGFSQAPGSPISGTHINVAFRLATADFNLDGNPDLAVAQLNTLPILLGDGTGRFTVAPNSPALISGSLGIESGNLNNDAFPDLAFVNGQGVLIRILLGNGTGQFPTGSSVANRLSNDRSRNLRIADFNNDGNQDILVDSVDNNLITLTLGNGAGVFTVTPATRIDIGFRSSGIEAADFNNDGNVDFIASRDDDAGAITLRLGNGNGTFTDGGTLTGLSETDGLVAGNFNGDSNLDFAAALQDTNQLAVYLSRGTTRKPPFDYDGDGKTDLSIFRPAPGEWWYNKSSNGGNFAAQFGASTDKITPGDYTGDGKSDVAFFRPSSGQWFILRSEDFSFYAFPFGNGTDTPVPADYDGDGKADAAVFRPSTLTWFINKSSGGTQITTFGASGDVPAVGDYDGDGKADIAIYRPSLGQWWIQRSSNLSVSALSFGTSTDRIVQGDYTGDGKTDIAFWRPSNGNWFILRSEDFSFYSFPFGASTDTPAPGDYDGDGRFDAAVFRSSSSTWFVNRSTAGTLIQTFGIAGDIPTPAAFVP